MITDRSPCGETADFTGIDGSIGIQHTAVHSDVSHELRTGGRVLGNSREGTIDKSRKPI